MAAMGMGPARRFMGSGLGTANKLRAPRGGSQENGIIHVLLAHSVYLSPSASPPLLLSSSPPLLLSSSPPLLLSSSPPLRLSATLSPSMQPALCSQNFSLEKKREEAASCPFT
ncbi:unnamed protein product [Pleuronectes platessa]|uniref:Uncharacterized protein n=1 Tax=Pleuronectes platessa TaxID=8262 RepID=A0A9N7Z5I3_PLEPL|nr:unnamed protein product [Pleuronectes platessa]